MFQIEFTNVQGPEEGGKFGFRQNEVVVGSDFSCDLVLVHDAVMPRHARIVDEKEGVILEDLTGREETKLNGEFVSRAPLHNGDEFQVGPYVFHISLEVDAALDGRGDDGETAVLGGWDRMVAVAKKPPVLALILLLGIAGAYLGAEFVTSERVVEDLSALGPLELPASGMYGCRVGGKSYVDKVEFTFEGLRPKYRLQYYPGFIRRPDSVVIYVNDERVAAAPVTIDRWSEKAVTVEIPERAYRMGEINTVRFDNVRNPPDTERWGVRDVSVSEVPIPRCDIEAAKRYIGLARKRYGDRGITESNLYDAVQELKQGQEYLIACEDSDLKDELADTLKAYSEELQASYDAAMFNTRKFLKLADEASAKVELERVLRAIPDEGDLRHRRAKELLERIERAEASRRRR